MSDDVLHTIKVNFDRKTVLVYPYCIPFDPENVNTIVDIAVVSGTDVISSTKGQLISSLDPKSLGTIESCTLSSSVISIKNRSTKKRVQDQVLNLKRLLDDRQELEDILTKRIKSLSSSCIDINIPDDINFPSTSSRLDEGIRVIRAILENKFFPEEVAQKYVDAYVALMQDRDQEFLLWVEKD
jgi:hypothetical protein